MGMSDFPFHTYAEATQWLFAQLPMFQRDGAAAYKNNLDNTLALSAALGQPEKDFPTIHVAGTNGKGSTSHMLASVFQAAGFKTGLYTSPHLVDFSERIRINGVPIAQQEVLDFLQVAFPTLDALKPSFFETTVAMAFHHFAKEKVDIAIIETGMGGRLDSTNIITPLLSVITNIGWDHMAFLGNTLEAIAGEKAGIIKSCVPVVIGSRQKETEAVFKRMAQSQTAPLFFVDELVQVTPSQYQPETRSRTFSFQTPTSHFSVKSPLMGDYQKENLATVYAALEVLAKHTVWDLRAWFAQGVEQVLESTGFAGRWQILQTQPLAIADTAHNVDGFSRVMEQLASLKAPKYHLVLGFVSDKEVSKLLDLIQLPTDIYACAPALPRAMPVEKLCETLQTYPWPVQSFSSVMDAFQAAINFADKNDVIFVGGSTFVVAELQSSSFLPKI
jgi:dihydrofolate synthase / folylpolyglutamate synthase